MTAGGRVLTVCALVEDFAGAQQRAYPAVRKIEADGLFCRRDIGWRAIKR